MTSLKTLEVAYLSEDFFINEWTNFWKQDINIFKLFSFVPGKYFQACPILLYFWLYSNLLNKIGETWLGQML